MRFTAYASASAALAASVILKALHERPNFYSACVYLGQSNACVMILTNLTLLILGSFLFGLQKLLYGPLRPIEIEQLYEKGWFAVTETCLAMTIFREEVGAWFIVMFVALLVGKLWGWIGEGRVEILEQQPPADPRLFHARLSISLALSFIFTSYMFNYCVTTVQQQARPNMMVMFAFEFAVITITSLSTCARYGLSLREAAVIRQQTTQRMQERRSQILHDREEARKTAQENNEQQPEFPPIEEELNELEIDVPGWEDKGRWTFYLDLATDFFKLILYLTFFCVLCIFYGMPIHIIRDVALTVRSFYTRVTDFIKYRHATRDMNERYPDATEGEISREDTCIICREPMQPWQPPGAVQGEGPAPMEERVRPKKLPCGHILHFACLRSWLERQQKCPTCRQDVVAPTHTQPTQRPNQQPEGEAQPPANEEEQHRGRNNRPNDAPRQNLIRFLNLGPLRLGFGAGNDPEELQDEMLNQRPRQRPRNGADRAVQAARQLGLDFGFGRGVPSPTAVRNTQILRMERQLRQEINSLNFQHQELQVVRQLQQEYLRLRLRRTAIDRGDPDPGPAQPQTTAVQGYSYSPQHAPLPAGHHDLPPGVTIPEGWQLTPLVPFSPRISQGQVFGLPQHSFGFNNQLPTFSTPGPSLQNNQTSSLQQASEGVQSTAQAVSASRPENSENVNGANDTAARSGLGLQQVAGDPSTADGINPGLPNEIHDAPGQATPTSQPGASHLGPFSQPPENGDFNPTSITSSEESDKPVSDPPIPNWGSQSSSKSPNHTMMNQSSSGEEGSVPAATHGDAQSPKGKAKAATVEDADDEAA